MAWSWCSLAPMCSFLYLFGFLTYTYCISYEWLGFTSLGGLLDFFLNSFLFYELFYNYIQAVITDPGKVPENWRPYDLNDEELEKLKKEVKHNRDINSEESIDYNRAKWCSRCMNIKPPRAHHCSECNRCVLKMDHHCPWINNCVGHYNHKHFMLFLVYIVMESVHMYIFYIWRLVLLGSNLSFEQTIPLGVRINFLLIIIQMVIMVPTLVGTLCLCVFQCQLILENTTSIESFDKEYEVKRAKRKGKEYRFPFDRGLIKNLKDVFGSKLHLWLLPTSPENDGLYYKVFHSDQS